MYSLDQVRRVVIPLPGPEDTPQIYASIFDKCIKLCIWVDTAESAAASSAGGAAVVSPRAAPLTLCGNVRRPREVGQPLETGKKNISGQGGKGIDDGQAPQRRRDVQRSPTIIQSTEHSVTYTAVDISYSALP